MIGRIFEHNGRWWKINGPMQFRWGKDGTWPVISCSKTGKEFTRLNGFSDFFVMRKDAAGLLYYAVSNEKCSTAGKEIGIKKRRIQFLKTRIADDQAELDRLVEEIG